MNPTPSPLNDMAAAWFTIGGWTLAAGLAAWHWRNPIIDSVDRILDWADRAVARRQAGRSW